MSPRTIKVFIADDHATLSDGLMAMISAVPGFTVMGKAADGEELLEKLRHKTVDVLLLDINMPRLNGLEVLPMLRERYPQLGIIMLSINNTRSHITRANQLGASGYLTKGSDQQEILTAIRAVAEGGKYYSQEVTRTIMELREPSRGNAPVELTARERSIICLITKELTSREIGERLQISPHTVERHRKNIFNKLGVRNVVGLVNYAHKHGLNREDCTDL